MKRTRPKAANVPATAKSHSALHRLNARELATISAALLFYVANVERFNVPMHLIELAKKHGRALLPHEIDNLCERLNR